MGTMRSETPDGKAPRELQGSPGGSEKKPWQAPRLAAVSIAGLTEGMLNPGNDGAGTSTLS